MRKAFIAAPLIGTIIFVTAVVFVVNISKSENNAITQISQEAYHNRINSIVELYRSDAGSLFREDVKKVIEQALTSQCWNLFYMQVQNSPGDDADQKLLNLKTERYERCQAIKSTIQSVVCSNTGEQDSTCSNQCSSTLTDEQYAACIEINCAGTAPKSYGLQNFFNNINEPFSFEGMELSPSNQDKFKQFFKPVDPVTGNVDLVQYISNCRILMKELTMDCAAFSEGKLQCCSVDTALGNECPAEKVIPGCESGIFYVKVTPSDPAVYSSLPRIQARDEAGNYLRAGALGDADEFLLPITFPLLKYLDASFNSYSRLAYGVGIGVSDGDSEGVLDGICRAPQAVCASDDVGLASAVPGSVISGGNANEVETQLASEYYENVFLPAFQETLPKDLKLLILTAGEEPSGECKWSGNSFECDASAEEEVKKQIVSGVQSVQGTGATGIWYPFVDDFDLRFKIIDTDPSFAVKQGEQNSFCTKAVLKYGA